MISWIGGTGTWSLWSALGKLMEEREQQLLDQLDRRNRDLVSSR